MVPVCIYLGSVLLGIISFLIGYKLGKRLEFRAISEEMELRDKLYPSNEASFSPVTRLPDGSAFCTASFPLPKDHWIYREHPDGESPPMPFRRGKGKIRDRLATKIRLASRYAIRASTMHGKEMDFDPDAMVQNMVVGMLGYWTDTGYNTNGWMYSRRK